MTRRAMSDPREKVKCNTCFHCEPDPDFVYQGSYMKPDNRRDSICEVQPGKKVKHNLPRYCELFKLRYIREPSNNSTYPQGKVRDIKRDPIGTREGDPGYTGPITTIEYCKNKNHGGKTFHKDGKCMVCSYEEVKNK